MAEPSTPLPVRRTLYELGSGLGLGFLAACFIGPTLVSKYYQPLSKDAISCGPAVDDALGGFVRVQLIMALVGATGVWLVLFLIRRAMRRRREASLPKV